MTLDERKLAFIQEFLLLEDLEILNDLEKALESFKNQTQDDNMKTMNLEKSNALIDQSISDAENGDFISAEELKAKIKKLT